MPEPLGAKLVIIKETYEGKRGGRGFSKSIDYVGSTTETPTTTTAAAPPASSDEKGVTTDPTMDFSYGEMFEAEEMQKQGK